MSEEEKIAVYDDKYEFYMKDHSLHCKRYGEEWRDFIGDGAVLQLFLHAVEQQEEMKNLEKLIIDIFSGENLYLLYHRGNSVIQQHYPKQLKDLVERIEKAIGVSIGSG